MRRVPRLLAWMLAVVWIVWGGLALAQTDIELPDFAAWEAVATRAEATIESDRASGAQLDALRSTLVDWRETFLNAQSINEIRIQTVQEQIAALGAAPAEGETEPEDIASRRQELNDRLAELRAPRLKAEEAYNRANGLVAELDANLRERAARELSELGPTPFNPVLWPTALAALAGLGSELADEVRGAFGAAGGIDPQNAPRALFFLLIAVALILRGQRWMQRATHAISRRLSGAVQGVGVFLVSLGQLAVPILGIYALIEAVGSLGILGDKGKVLINTLPVIGLYFFGAGWLGRRIFPASPEEAAPFALSDQTRAEGRTYASILGLLFGLDLLAERVADIAGFDAGIRAVMFFPILALAAVVLLRNGLNILRERRALIAAGNTPHFITLLGAVLGRATVVLSLLGLVAASVGYLNAARAVIFPTALSLVLVGLLTVLFMLIRDGYGALRGKSRDEADQSLIPVLLSFALTLSSVPLFALIWGARATDIAEVWARIREGFAIGETRISPADFLTFIAVFVLVWGLTRILQTTLRTAVLPKTRLDTGGQNAITSGLGYVGIIIAIIAAITSAGIDLSNIALVAGALSVGIGFGLQNVVSNFVSGIILLIERPIGEGDWIEVGGQMGIVKAISVRSTRIETFDRTDVIVPNADLVSGTVTNWTKGNLMGRVTLSVGVAYGANARRVEEILREICENHPLVAVDPAPSVFFRRFGADALEFDCFCILRDVNYKLSVHSELNHQVHERFRAEGIEIPFAQRDLWLRNPEVLHSPPAPTSVPPRASSTGPEAPAATPVPAPDTWDD